MRGFGPGADQRTVTAITRDRPMLGGSPTAVAAGLASTLRQRRLAR
ncbi:hypothetical protein [Arthrobacter sp. H35-D1]|nr:hypothetical protein [Arthrobacter sp. H35-D1]MDJ0315175.1 hypothetical protein [Arthrobacter sp. H35-D1]